MTVWMTEAEYRIGTNQNDIASLLNQKTTMKVSIEVLMHKVDDLENRCQCSNFHLVGLPEKKEGTDLHLSLEKWIPDVLGSENFPGA